MSGSSDSSGQTSQTRNPFKNGLRNGAQRHKRECNWQWDSVGRTDELERGEQSAEGRERKGGKGRDEAYSPLNDLWEKRHASAHSTAARKVKWTFCWRANTRRWRGDGRWPPSFLSTGSIVLMPSHSVFFSTWCILGEEVLRFIKKKIWQKRILKEQDWH